MKNKTTLKKKPRVRNIKTRKMCARVVWTQVYGENRSLLKRRDGKSKSEDIVSSKDGSRVPCDWLPEDRV